MIKIKSSYQVSTITSGTNVVHVYKNSHIQNRVKVC